LDASIRRLFDCIIEELYLFTAIFDKAVTCGEGKLRWNLNNVQHDDSHRLATCDIDSCVE
jgi:hypothetical protein